MSAVAAAIVVATSVATTATAIATAAASALTGDDVDERLDFFLGSIVHRDYLALEYEVHASVGVVKVDGNGLFLNVNYEPIHALPVGIHEGNNVAGIDLLVVELAIYAEDVLVYVEYKVVAAVAIGLVLGEGEVEGVSFFQRLELLFESLKGETQASGKLEGMLFGGLLYKLFNSFILGIHVVRYNDRLARIDFCHSLLCLLYIIRSCKGTASREKYQIYLGISEPCTTFAA